MHVMQTSKRWLWYWDLIQVLLHKELAVRYKGSLLGFFWSVMNPLALAAVYYLVFAIYMRFNSPHYLIALLSAMFPWQWFCNSVSLGPFMFLSNPTLVKKVAFPRQTIPLVTNMQDMVHFFMSLPVFLIFKLADGMFPDWNWLWGIPLLSLITLVNVYGICLIVGTLNLFFRDLGNIVNIAINMIFFATPIFYVLDAVPIKYLIYFKLNPIAPLFISWRSLLMNNTFREDFLLLSIVYAVAFCSLGILIYMHFQRKFAEVL